MPGRASSTRSGPRASSPVPQTISGTSWLTSGPWAGTPDACLDADEHIGVLYQIVSRLATRVSLTPWSVYARAVGAPPEERELIADHPLAQLMATPNRAMSWGDMIAWSQTHLELLGEGALGITKVEIGRVRVAREIWPIRPDTLAPDRDPYELMTGWTQAGPQGQRTRLDVDQVAWCRYPHPRDPIRGLGPVQAAMDDVSAARLTSEFINSFLSEGNFFGLIYNAREERNEEEFNRLRRRIHQMRGARNAGKAFYVEGEDEAKPISYSLKDLAFPEIKQLTIDAIIAAFGFPRALLGVTDGVPRDVARVQMDMLDSELVHPRLVLWRSTLNRTLVPYFTPLLGRARQIIELDFADPRKKDAKEEAETTKTKVEAASILIAAGVEPAAAFRAVGLPDMPIRPAVTVTTPPTAALPRTAATRVPSEPTSPATTPEVAAAVSPEWHPAARYPEDGRMLRPDCEAQIPDNPDYPPLDDADLPDLTPIQDAYLQALAALLATWTDSILPSQYAALLEQIRTIVDEERWGDLAGLSTPTMDAATELAAAMTSLAQDTAGTTADMVADAGGPTVEDPAELVDTDAMTSQAATVTALLGVGLALTAGWAALRHRDSGEQTADIVQAVSEHLDQLTIAQPQLTLGGALGTAQATAQTAVYTQAETLPGPTPAYYADETLDTNTCTRCARVHKKWLGNTIADARVLYPGGHYVDCEGGVRCRGQVVVVYRPGSDESKWVEKQPVKEEGT